jgi:lysophospholipase L1-like esterase
MRISGKNIWKKLKAICFGIFLGLLFCEIFLRIYNPLPFSIKKGKLILPANQNKVFTNNWIHKLDKEIHFSRNSLGFRGPELPDSFSKFISIITIGGSTTACTFLSDSSTWPFLLYQGLKSKYSKVWLNNAGIDGHSTFGHLLLLKEYVLKLKPKYVILMPGINDVETDAPDEFDLMTEKKINTNSFKDFIKSLLNYTELGRTAFNFYHVQLAYKKGLVHKEVNFARLTDNPLPDSIVSEEIEKQKPYVSAYRERISKIVSECIQAGIKPILITQPSLFGSYTDSITQLPMANKWVKKTTTENCLLNEKKLELYNDVLRTYVNQITVIDLSHEMPKNSGYYYDFIHFTNEGAALVSKILFTHLDSVFIQQGLK